MGNTEKLSISIIIPVYNEERYLAACLDSIAAQTEPLHEVIVIDNNSTDKSVAIAHGYRFVKVLHEKRQHQVFAQATGFNTATGDILGRIDGDSVLPPDWVRRVKQAFQDEATMGVTGGADPYDVPFKWLGMAIFNWYLFMVCLIVGHRMLWGANCAIRRSGWLKAKNKVLMRPDIWEDYDLACCLAPYGKIKYLRGLRTGVSFRAIHATFRQHVSYQFRSVRTFYLRTNRLKLAFFILLWTTTFIVYPLAALDDWALRRRAS